MPVSRVTEARRVIQNRDPNGLAIDHARVIDPGRAFAPRGIVFDTFGIHDLSAFFCFRIQHARDPQAEHAFLRVAENGGFVRGSCQRDESVEDSLIRNQLDLAGKRVYVQKASPYYTRLLNLSEEIGEEINIIQDSIFGMEQLVAMVAKKEISYTVCDENVAKVNKIYYPDLDIETPVSFPQKIAWAVRHDSPEWLNYLNNWIINFRKSATYRVLYEKYFESPRSATRFNSDYNSYTGGKISPYDDLIREVCKEAGMDWRLVAAVIRQESNFDPAAESWSGSYGLMQVRPESADMFKIQDYKNPRGNILVGVSLLKWLDEHFKIEVPDSTERIKFTLAAYNVGLGHVQDAQRLAEKYDRIPIVWEDNVDFFLLNKSAAKYYRDPVAKYGYCRGDESYEFVMKVLDTYSHYLNVIGK